jgi:uncharacterized protein YcbK (DUF882 family)
VAAGRPRGPGRKNAELNSRAGVLKTKNFGYNPAMLRLLKMLSFAITLAVLCSTQGAAGDSRSLKFYHTHTQQTLQVTYYAGGDYVPDALRDIRLFLADWRNKKQVDIDPELLDILWQIQRVTGSREAFEVISAYRSPETNDLLRGRSSGVAKKSQHLLGKAIDVRLRGTDLEQLHRTASDLKLGGVGYYPDSEFVHVDTGRVRYW